MSWLAGLFSGGTIKAIENIATEVIETEKESAEAKAVMIKTLDPNGLMRRDMSKRVTDLFTLYILTAMLLLLLSAFNIGNQEQITNAINFIKDLFVPITTSFTAILGASFGVNAVNANRGK